MTNKQSDSNTKSFTPKIDKRIIDGFLGDKERMIEELARAGFSRIAILSRAEKLGLSNQFVQQCHLSGTDVKIRRCLACNKVFVSMGPQNRLCRHCKTKS